MNKKFAINIPNSASYEAIRKDMKKTQQSQDENPHAVRGDPYIDDSCSDESERDKHLKSNDKHPENYPLVEFEEFTVQKKPSEFKLDKKRRYEIEVPEIKFDHNNSLVKRQPSPETDDVFKDYICKEPPAPSKGSSKAKVFVFPTAQPVVSDNTQKEKPSRYPSNPPERPQIQATNKQRQEFAKERQKYQKELLIKDAQIDLMQKLIGEHMNMKYQFSNFHEAQRILAEKDLRHSDLLSKMQEMSNLIKTKNEQIAQLKYQNERMQGLLESMQHTMYMLTKKQDNSKLTQEFYQMRQDNEQRHAKSYWEQQRRSSLKQQSCIRNIEDLQKRLEFLKSNRIQLENSKSRHKNKSVLTSIPKQEILWCSMTSKHKPKGTFDFKFHKDRSIESGSFIEKGKKKDLF